MISYFPQIRNEESIYSIFSRLQFALQPLAMGYMGKTLFNNKNEMGRLNFQGPFDYLCNNLPSFYTSEYFLFYHTIYPLFVPFLSIDEQEKALKHFKSSNSKDLRRYINLRYITKDKTYIRVCKECIREDFVFYGEPYYNRQHEIELNRMCHKHRVPLYEYTISNYKVPRKYEDYLTVLSNSREISIPEEFKGRFLSIAEDINSIFTLNLFNWNIEDTKWKVFDIVLKKGYLSPNGAKLNIKMYIDFKMYYSEEFLNYIGYNVDINSPNNWLSNITGGLLPVADPIKFILVIRFLSGSLLNFYRCKEIID